MYVCTYVCPVIVNSNMPFLDHLCASYLGSDTRGLRTPSSKATVPQLVKKFPAFYKKPESPLPCSQQPATGPYPKPDETSPQLPTLVRPSGLSLPYGLQDPPISFSLIWSPRNVYTRPVSQLVPHAQSTNAGISSVNVHSFLSMRLDYACIPELAWKVTPWSRVLVEKLVVAQMVKKFLALYGTRKFITT
jgi:hypothetical protein